MHMVILAIEFDQLGIEISADACKDWPQIIQSLFRVANKTLLALLHDLVVLTRTVYGRAPSCAFPVGCSLGASSRKIEGANQTTHEAPNEHP